MWDVRSCKAVRTFSSHKNVQVSCYSDDCLMYMPSLGLSIDIHWTHKTSLGLLLPTGHRPLVCSYDCASDGYYSAIEVNFSLLFWLLFFQSQRSAPQQVVLQSCKSTSLQQQKPLSFHASAGKHTLC
jgi:hypothetical protein